LTFRGICALMGPEKRLYEKDALLLWRVYCMDKSLKPSKGREKKV